MRLGVLLDGLAADDHVVAANRQPPAARSTWSHRSASSSARHSPVTITSPTRVPQSPSCSQVAVKMRPACTTVGGSGCASVDAVRQRSAGREVNVTDRRGCQRSAVVRRCSITAQPAVRSDARDSRLRAASLVDHDAGLLGTPAARKRFKPRFASGSSVVDSDRYIR